MGRSSRTFKLRLSPAGMDVLIDSHCHLIRTTRSLLAWGTTLHVAVDYLDTIPVGRIVDLLNRIEIAELNGSEVHHLGAPHRLSTIAAGIAQRVGPLAPDLEPPTIGSIYLVALCEILHADGDALRAAYERANLRPNAGSLEAPSDC